MLLRDCTNQPACLTSKPPVANPNITPSPLPLSSGNIGDLVMVCLLEMRLWDGTYPNNKYTFPLHHSTAIATCLLPKIIALLESVPTVLTQPGAPVSFRGMCICLLFDFRKLRNFRCFPFPENSGTPTFLISGNSGLRCFLLLVIHSCISPFTCDSIVSPLFHVLFSFMYSGLLSVPGTYLSHSLVYKYLYSVDRRSRIKITIPLPLV